MKKNYVKTKAALCMATFMLLTAAKPKPANGPGGNKILADANTNRGIVARYSSFDVAVPAGVIPLNTLYKYALEPDGPFGGPCFLNFTMNSDNTIDALWVANPEAYDYGYRTHDKHFARISVDGKNLVKNLVLPPVSLERDRRFLGYESLGNDKYMLGYSSLPEPGTINTVEEGKTITKAYFSGFDGNSGIPYFTTEIFRDPAITSTYFGGPPYLPGQTCNTVLRLNKAKNTVALYMGHRNEDGHQGGWFTMFNATTGAKVVDANNAYIGQTWNYSHIFDLRMIVPQQGNADFYTISHLDSTPERGLLFTKWTVANGRDAQANRLNYFPIPGDGNYTFTRTGDFIELPNGDVAVVFSTSVKPGGDVSGPKNIKLAIITQTGTTGKPVVKSITDLTSYDVASGLTAGIGMQLSLSGQNEILVGWNVFNPNAVALKTSFRLVDFNGNITSTIEDINKPLIYQAQSMKHTVNGADRIVFVSEGDAPNTLKVNVFGPETTLPVKFSKINAKIEANQLSVNWSTASETNNHHFDIEVSKNGTDFTKIGEVASKSDNGNSETGNDYTFSKSLTGAMATLPLILLALFPAGSSRRRRLFSAIAITGAIVYFASCKKTDTIDGSQNQKVYVRVAQVDIDGKKGYSDIAVVNP